MRRAGSARSKTSVRWNWTKPMLCAMRSWRASSERMQIHYRNEVRGSGVDARALKSAMRKLLAGVEQGDASISLTLVNDAAIREINRAHRGKDAPTDVLSFPLEPEPFAHEKLLG